MPIGILNPLPPMVSPAGTVEANTGNATLTYANFNKNQTNTGAAGTIQLTLPAAATVAGMSLRVQLTAAQIVQVVPASGEKIFLGGDGVASKWLAIAAVIGNFADLYCDGDKFLCTNYSGVVTKQP